MKGSHTLHKYPERILKVNIETKYKIKLMAKVWIQSKPE